MQRINERVVQLNHAEANPRARYVLYWMQMYKRTSRNHALTFAIRKANEYNLPLVVYEGLKYYYPWANDRLHTLLGKSVLERGWEGYRLNNRSGKYFNRGSCGSSG